MPRYNPATLEPKWQNFWDKNRTFATPREPKGEKFYVLDMFPYPSGNGLHVGHPEGYTATDIVCRAARMQGKTVLHPMGFDAFGLPAEEHAIKTGQHPRVSTEENITTFRRQLKMLGFSYDWERELATTDVEYFRWTQWIFLQLFDTWYDRDQQKGRPISELPIPEEISAAGEEAVYEYISEHRLAYQTEAPVNWCPALSTVLANEEIINGLSERGGHPVVRMPLRQWMLRITDYADRLESELDGLDWSSGVIALQKNWIGRSVGAEVDFFIGEERTNSTPTEKVFTAWLATRQQQGLPRKPGTQALRVYTTRPDTLFGATYMVLAPEHPFVERLTIPEQKSVVAAYCENAAGKSDLDRTELNKEKTGVFTGSYAMNPVSGQPVPIWIADYVLISYGTGAIMAVPAHDERDFEFAEKFGIAIQAVVDPGEAVSTQEREKVLAGKLVFAASGTGVNSGEFNGAATEEFKSRMLTWLVERGVGKKAVNYKLRDWLFSRQRFWGEPFPILHELDENRKKTGRVRAVTADQLPVNLPDMKEYKPHGLPEPPLDNAPEEWLYPVIDGVTYKRETNTMPQWAGSCWYYLRFIDTKNNEILLDPELEKAWMPIDLYVGGAEHAVLHLLYARFWHKVLYDRGFVSTKEPFQKLVNQGMILGEVEFTGYKNEAGDLVSSADAKKGGEPNSFVSVQTGEKLNAYQVLEHEVVKKGEGFVLKETAEIRIDSRAHKMSKSRGNVINPDIVVSEYGADALRLYEMFMGPLEATKPWSMDGVNGVFNFLNRVWRLFVDEREDELQLNGTVQETTPTADQNRILHLTIQAVTKDIENMDFNTAIARMMEFTNFFTKQKVRPKSAMEKFVLLLAPFAPHLCEELWQLLGHSDTLSYEPWPKFEASFIQQDHQEVIVQIKGKMRAKIKVATDASKETLEAAAREDARIVEILKDKEIIKTIVVPGRLVNFVTKN